MLLKIIHVESPTVSTREHLEWPAGLTAHLWAALVWTVAPRGVVGRPIELTWTSC